MFKRISEWLVLTRTEQKVILFLSITALAGAGIRLYQKAFASAPQFDYSVSDSAFASLSSASIDSVDSLVMQSIEETSVKININTATKQQLMDLPGIGETMAERILKYRKDIGKFNSVDDLLSVKGISTKKFEKIKPLITTQ